MKTKRPYKHILKNLLHEQATEIIPLLMPGYRVLQAFDVEMPDLKSTEIEGPMADLGEGIVGLALPEAKVLKAYKTEWIEHSGKFERAYRIQNTETDQPTYLVIEFQTEREDEHLPRQLLGVYARILRYAREDVAQEDEEFEDEEFEDEESEDEDEESEDEQSEDEDFDVEEEEHKGTVVNRGYYVYPVIVCPFPQAIPAPIPDTFDGQVMLEFNFRKVCLWEKDAREFLNTHVSATYFLLPAMKNADAALLGIAIEELAQRFQDDDGELGRHLTGLSLLLQESEMMSEEEKLAAQEHLQKYTHLIKNDPYED